MCVVMCVCVAVDMSPHAYPGTALIQYYMSYSVTTGVEKPVQTPAIPAPLTTSILKALISGFTRRAALWQLLC